MTAIINRCQAMTIVSIAMIENANVNVRDAMKPQQLAARLSALSLTIGATTATIPLSRVQNSATFVLQMNAGVTVTSAICQTAPPTLRLWGPLSGETCPLLHRHQWPLCQWLRAVDQ